MSEPDPRLRALLERADDIHRETLAQTRGEVALVAAPRTGASRRDFLVRAGMAGAFAGGMAMVMPSLAHGAPSKSDADTVNFAIRVELFAVGAYTLAARNARRLKLTSAQVEVGKLFASHHAAHAKAEQDFLRGLGMKPATTALKTDAELKPLGLSNAALKKAFSTGTGALTAALYVEEMAAKTYSDFAVETKDRGVSDFAWSIAPVELGHAAYLRAALGKGPVKASFAGAITPTKP